MEAFPVGRSPSVGKLKPQLELGSRSASRTAEEESATEKAGEVFFMAEGAKSSVAACMSSGDAVDRAGESASELIADLSVEEAERSAARPAEAPGFSGPD